MKGFTLIELLAVIVILAIILLIAMPIVLNVINEARKGAFESTARGLMKTAENQCMKEMVNDSVTQITYNFESGVQTTDPEGAGLLEFSGRAPEDGYIIVYENCDVEIAITDGVWYVEKAREDKDVVAVLYDGQLDEIACEPTPDEYFIFNESTQTITGYESGIPLDLCIPEQINGIDVLAIGESAFYDAGLTSVYIPRSITFVGNGSFMYNDLTAVTLYDGVDYDWDWGWTFAYNYLLTDVTIEEGIETIPHGMFYRCYSLEEIVLPESLVTIGYEAFGSNSCCTNLVIPNNVKNILWRAFGKQNSSSQKGIETLVLGESVEIIEDDAFYGSKIETLVVPNSVTTIGASAFIGNLISNLTIGNSVTSIGNSAFRNNSLTTVTIPNSVTTIGDNAFDENNLSGTISLSSNVTSVGNRAFCGIGPSNLTWGGKTEADYWKNSGAQITGHIAPGRDMTIPSTANGTSVTSVAQYAFRGCNLKDVIIPSEITVVNKSAFTGAESINWIGKTEEQHWIRSGVLLNGHIGPTLNLVIPSSISGSNITHINDWTFSGDNLESLVISNGITWIGSSAFSGNNISNIVLPNSVTSIGDTAFRFNQIESLTLPTNLTTIGSWTFADNILTNIVLPNSLTTMGTAAFENNQLTSVTFPNNIATIPAQVFNRNSFSTITIPNSVTTISQNAFRNNQLTSIDIGSGVTTIGTYAFASNKILQGSAIIRRAEGDVTYSTSDSSGSFINNGADGLTKITPTFIP